MALKRLNLLATRPIEFFFLYCDSGNTSLSALFVRGFGKNRLPCVFFFFFFFFIHNGSEIILNSFGLVSERIFWEGGRCKAFLW